MDSSQINYITLLKYKEVRIIIQNAPSLLIMGITDTGKIFMRCRFNNIYCYENLINSEFAEHAFNFILNKLINNNYSIEFMDESKTLDILLQNDNNPNNDNYIRIGLIFKNNLNKIKITNEDIMKSLYDFNIKYNASINNTQIIDLCSRSIQDNGFRDLSNIKLNIIILNLSYNKIKDISPLNSDCFKNLQKLYLNNNEIEDLRCLNNLRLDYLLELKLDYNKIVDIAPLENAIFKQIQILNLGQNKISNIDALQNLEFDYLIHLNLSGNLIVNISSLKNTEFSKLIELDLSNNNINDVSIFEKINLQSLQVLNLSNNKIDKIHIKKKFYFHQLKTILINNNQIKEIIIEGKIQLNKLKAIHLSHNLFLQIY